MAENIIFYKNQFEQYDDLGHHNISVVVHL